VARRAQEGFFLRVRQRPALTGHQSLVQRQRPDGETLQINHLRSDFTHHALHLVVFPLADYYLRFAVAPAEQFRGPTYDAAAERDKDAAPIGAGVS
jgi:hypothetical protein